MKTGYGNSESPGIELIEKATSETYALVFYYLENTKYAKKIIQTFTIQKCNYLAKSQSSNRELQL